MSAASTPSTQLVCVTGGSGYIASHIVKQLLEQGFRVRATVRDPGDAKVKFLLDIAAAANASDRLTLVKADLLDMGSFDEAVKDCDVVLHTASPFMINKSGDPHKLFIRPAVQGVENVLTACGKAPSVKRVVVTSSVVAVYGHADDKPSGEYNEEDWNTTSTLEDPYALSKRMAEEKAWELAKAQTNYTLVTICPSLVLGPTLSGRNDAASVEIMHMIMGGKLRIGSPDLRLGVVDVREVALAHIRAFTSPKAEVQLFV